MNEVPDGFRETPLGPLPDTWEVTPLGEVVTFTRRHRGVDASAYEEVPFIPMAMVPANGVWIDQYELKPGVGIGSGVYCESGDLLLAKITPSFENGKQGIIGNTPLGFAFATTEVIPMRAKPGRLDQMFLFHYLKLAAVRDDIASKMEGSTGRQRIPKAVIQGRQVPLPPLPEQRAIARVLRTVQRAREATEDVIAAARELKRSLMHHLFTYGPVPVDEAERVELKETELGLHPAPWEVTTVGGLCSVKGGKRLPKGHRFSEEPTAYPYIRVTDFINWSVNLTDLRYLQPEDHEKLQRYIITADDVYISIAGTIGLVGTVPEEVSGANLTENAARIVIDRKQVLNRGYLVGFVASGKGQRLIDSRTTKTSQPKLALTRIRQMPIPLPPLPEQRAIARILGAVDAKITAEEARRDALDKLFRTLLHHLMTGQVRVTHLIKEVQP